jgi:uncharacterized protein with PIN domain
MQFGGNTTFEVERMHVDDEKGSYDMLRVRCPQCTRVFWVIGRWLRLAKRVTKRPCPYCAEQSKIPRDLVVH